MIDEPVISAQQAALYSVSMLPDGEKGLRDGINTGERSWP